MFAGGGRQKTGSRGTGFDARPSPLQSIPELKNGHQNVLQRLIFPRTQQYG
jgi:hypothetical protein